MSRLPLPWLLSLIVLTGCQSQQERLRAEGYPPAFAAGFEAGCGSGRQAAGGFGGFHKDVVRYSTLPLYAQGWDDGFNQCQAMEEERDREAYWHQRYDTREEEWEREKDRAWANALRHHP